MKYRLAVTWEALKGAFYTYQGVAELVDASGKPPAGAGMGMTDMRAAHRSPKTVETTLNLIGLASPSDAGSNPVPLTYRSLWEMFSFSIKNKPEKTMDEMFKTDSEKAQNIVLNLFSGLDLDHLTQEEEELLVKEYGENWMEKFGYDEDSVKKDKTT